MYTNYSFDIQIDNYYKKILMFTSNYKLKNFYYKNVYDFKITDKKNP